MRLTANSQPFEVLMTIRSHRRLPRLKEERELAAAVQKQTSSGLGGMLLVIKGDTRSLYYIRVLGLGCRSRSIERAVVAA